MKNLYSKINKVKYKSVDLLNDEIHIVTKTDTTLKIGGNEDEYYLDEWDNGDWLNVHFGQEEDILEYLNV